MQAVLAEYTNGWKSLDYVSGWFMKAAEYGRQTDAATAFVSTNSICQGRQVATLWPLIHATSHEINFAHTSFKWANLASHNAGVTVVVVGISARSTVTRRLSSIADDGLVVVRETSHINAYLTPGANVVVEAEPEPVAQLASMSFGSMPNDGGHLLLDVQEADMAIRAHGVNASLIHPFLGSEEFIRGKERRYIWVSDALCHE